MIDGSGLIAFTRNFNLMGTQEWVIHKDSKDID